MPNPTPEYYSEDIGEKRALPPVKVQTTGKSMQDYTGAETTLMETPSTGEIVPVDKRLADLLQRATKGKMKQDKVEQYNRLLKKGVFNPSRDPALQRLLEDMGQIYSGTKTLIDFKTARERDAERPRSRGKVLFEIQETGAQSRRRLLIDRLRRTYPSLSNQQLSEMADRLPSK